MLSFLGILTEAEICDLLENENLSEVEGFDEDDDDFEPNTL